LFFDICETNEKNSWLIFERMPTQTVNPIRN